MAVGLIGIIPNSALAGTFDGSQPVICAVIETFECGEGASCERGLAESINFPQFIKIDFKTKSITGTLPNGMVRTAEIKHMEAHVGKLILQGADDGVAGVRDGLAWSVVIDDSSGRLVLSASGDGFVIVAFGACTLR